jgi:hypothetical protein
MAYRGSRLRFLAGATNAAVGPVVETVRVDGVPGVIDDGLSAQAIPTPDGPEQVRFTAELNPFCGVIFRV